jgi:hypothetical protein
MECSAMMLMFSASSMERIVFERLLADAIRLYCRPPMKLISLFRDAC